LDELVPARGVADLYDTIRVRHVSGGVSTIALKSYVSGRERFQGETLDIVWLDEEPAAEIYTECLTRTNVSSNPIFMTFTPLLGVSEVVRRFLMEESPDRSVTTMTIDDVEHYSDEERARIIASYPAHELEARTKGIPTLGSGRIFPVPEDMIAIEHCDFPKHWPRIGGMDFGWTHYFAAVELVWDRDNDCVYVAKAYRSRETTPIMHAAALRPWGKHLRWAWPRDGRRETLEGAGISLANQYREQGLDMWHEHAQFEDGSVSVEAGLMMMLDRMQSSRFKVFKHLNDWFEEFRLYHRRDGKVWKEGDDLMAATRYAVMMLRHAQTESGSASFNRPIDYPKRKYV
jgi:phage terminase large subunit-like protein